MLRRVRSVSDTDRWVSISIHPLHQYYRMRSAGCKAVTEIFSIAVYGIDRINMLFVVYVLVVVYVLSEFLYAR